MYVHARRCMFLVGLWDRSDVVARGRKSHAKVGIWSAMADNILCFADFMCKFTKPLACIQFSVADLTLARC